MSTHIAIAHLQDLAEGKLFPAHVEGVDLVVIRSGDGALVLEGRCPHQGTLLAEGFLDAGALVCRAHGWRFDCASGVRIGHPDVCLQTFPARVDAGSVLVERAALLAWKRGRAPAGAPADRPEATSLRELPGPMGLPFLGNLCQLDLKRLHLVLEKWCAQFGPIYAFRLGTKPIVVVADPTLIAAILRDRPETYRRLGTMEAVFKDMGVNGVFTAEGEDWRRQRRLVMEALDTRHLHQFFPTLVKVTRRLKRRWDQAAASGKPLEVQNDLMRYTVDVTASLVLGCDMNSLEHKGHGIQQHLEMLLPMINRRINAPFRWWRWWKLPADRALDAALVAIRQATDAFVAQARARLARSPELVQNPTNLLESMLAARDNGDDRFTDDELFGNILTMLVAGEDTTANTIAWMIHFMTEHPDVQGRMQAEADAVLGREDVPADVETAENLAYIEAVANETMRLKPVAPVLFLEPNEEVDVAGVRIPRGTGLFLLTRVSGLQERNFTEADVFRPERWLAGAASAGTHNRNVFMPFGMGPRFCPGRNLALLEIETVLGMVCRGFDLARDRDVEPTAEAFAFTMMPTNLSVLLRPRGGS